MTIITQQAEVKTRSQAVARIADLTASGHLWDHLIAHMPFPIGVLWNLASISDGFRDIQRRM